MRRYKQHSVTINSPYVLILSYNNSGYDENWRRKLIIPGPAKSRSAYFQLIRSPNLRPTQQRTPIAQIVPPERKEAHRVSRASKQHSPWCISRRRSCPSWPTANSSRTAARPSSTVAFLAFVYHCCPVNRVRKFSPAKWAWNRSNIV